MLHHLRALLRYRGLIQQTVARDLKARYRGSVLGFFWSFFSLPPLMAVYTFVFTTIMPGAPSREHPSLYGLFFFCGILPWTWFSLVAPANRPTSSSLAGNLIKKVLFPAQVLPIVAVLANLGHFLLGLPILALLLLYGFTASARSDWSCSRFPVIIARAVPVHDPGLRCCWRR